LRVDAAAYRRKSVFFQVIGPWTATDTPSLGDAGQHGVWFIWAISIPLGVRNLWRRTDLRSAARLVCALGGWVLFVWVFAGHPNLRFEVEWVQVTSRLAEICLLALPIGFCYLAVEPAVRRRWPWQVTAWNHLLAGRWRGPMVGRDILVGLVAGSAFYAFLQATIAISGGGGQSFFLLTAEMLFNPALWAPLNGAEGLRPIPARVEMAAFQV
jgi:hypothetical protein